MEDKLVRAAWQAGWRAGRRARRDHKFNVFPRFNGGPRGARHVSIAAVYSYSCTQGTCKLLHIPSELLEKIAHMLDPAALLAAACASRAVWQCFACDEWGARRHEAKEAINDALNFIRLEHETDWDDHGIEGPSIDEEEFREEGEEGEEGEKHEQTRVMWLPGPRTQRCNTLVDMIRCKTLVLAGRSLSGPRGYQVDPRGCTKDILMSNWHVGRRYGDFEGLFSLPRALCAALPALTDLDLKDNKISELPDDFCCLRSLTKLNLSCNSFVTIPVPLSALNTLQTLEMRWCFRLEDATGLSRLIQLYELHLDAHQLCASAGVPDLSKLHHLERLVMSPSPQLIELPPSLRMPTSLSTLTMGVGTGTLPAAMLTACASLRSLQLSGRFASLPAPYFHLPALTSLTVSGVGLVELPESIGELQQLEYLNVSRNHLAGLPASVARLLQLHACHLIGQSIAAKEIRHLGYDDVHEQMDSRPAPTYPPIRLREQMGLGLALDAARLPAVASLDLGSEQLLQKGEAVFRELPAAMLTHATLKRLHCQRCGVVLLRLDGAPSGGVHDGGLQFLSLCGNEIRELPCEISTLRSLVQFDLHQNRLVKLPPTMGELSSLRVLNVARNELCELPATLGHLTELRALQADHNRLTALPGLHAMTRLKVLIGCDNKLLSLEPFCNATSLLVLVLHRNCITELPTPFARLTQLIWLDLEDNPIKMVRKAVVQMTLPHAQHVKVDRAVKQLLTRHQSRLLQERPRPSTHVRAEARVFHEADEAELRDSPTALSWNLLY